MDGLVGRLAANAGTYNVVSQTSFGIPIRIPHQDFSSAPIGRHAGNHALVRAAGRRGAAAVLIAAFCDPVARVGCRHRRMRPGNTGRDLVGLI